MKRMRWTALILLAAVALVSFAGSSRSADAASASERGVLLLYDSQAISTPLQGNIETLARLLASFGKPADVESADDYRSGEMSAYGRVVVVRNAPDLPLGNSDYSRDLAAYGGGYLQIGGYDVPQRVRGRLNLRVQKTPPDTLRLTAAGYSELLPGIRETGVIAAGADGQVYGRLEHASSGAVTPYAVSDGTVAYASGLESGTLTELALAELLRDWLHANAAADRDAYVLIKEIYPFSDLDLLKAMADKLYDAGIPFVIAAKPVFHNTDYPAMKRYLQALSYAQTRNGTVAIDAPAVSAASSGDDSSLADKMSGFLNLLADNGIAPLGMNAPLFWAYDKAYSAAGMKFFDSVFLQPNDSNDPDASSLHASLSGSSASFASMPFSIPFEELQQFRQEGGPAREPMPMPTALTFDFFANETQLNAAVAALSDSWIPFADYKTSLHTVSTDSRTVRSDGGLLLVNGQSVDLNKAATEAGGDYDYTNEGKVSFQKLFSVQNRVLMAIFLAVLGLFGIFLFLGYRRYKLKFLRPGGDRHDDI